VLKEQTRLTAIMPAVVISHIQALQFGRKMDFSRFTLLISTNSVCNGVSQSSCFYELCNLLESKCMKVLQTKICVDRLVFMEITSNIFIWPEYNFPDLLMLYTVGVIMFVCNLCAWLKKRLIY